MAAVSSESFCLVLCLLLGSSEALKNITAEPGQDVTLPCRVLNNKPIIVVEWIRPDLDPDYVLLYRDGHLDPDIQHPSYENRVDLQDREMKDGNVSLILKNVMMEDRGTYECRVFQSGEILWTKATQDNKPISIIYLDVLPPGGEDGGRKDGGDKDGGDKGGGHKVGIIVGSVVGVILLLAVAIVGVLIYKRRMRKRSHLHVPPDEAAKRMF